MKKKFLSVVLLSALMIGAAGMFTACKDYDEDIKKLQEQIDANTAAITQINSVIQSGGVITSVTPTADGVQVTLSNNTSFTLTNGTEGKPGTVVTMGDDGFWYLDGKPTQNSWKGEAADNTLVYFVPGVEGDEEGYWVKVTEKDGEVISREIQSEKWAVAGSGVTAVLDKDNLTLGNVMVDGEAGTLVIALGGQLKSLVFIPETYWDGVEAKVYPAADGQYIVTTDPENPEGADYDGVAYTITDKAKAAWVYGNDSYLFSAIDTVSFHMNPVSTNISSVAEWSFLLKEAEYIFTRAEKTPEFEVLDAVQKDGNVSMAFKINNVEYLNYYKGEDPWDVDEDIISIAALNAKMKNDSTVTSDYFAILPQIVKLDAIAYTKASKYETIMDCEPELFITGEDAIKNLSTLSIAYNDAKGIDLKEILALHYRSQIIMDPSEEAFHKEMSYETAVKTYGLDFQFEMMPYQLGNHSTLESQYGMVKDGVFYPCYVDEKGNSVLCGDGAEGISAVGRRPVVLVTVVDSDDNVVLAGYIKIDIVQEVGFKDNVVKDFGQLPYVCGLEEETVWSEVSRNVYEHFGMTKEQFNAAYTVVRNETYVKKSATEMVRAQKDNVNDPYGMVEFVLDETPGTTNDKFIYEALLDEIENLYKDGVKTLYVKFVNNTNPNSLIYVGVTVEIADKPEVSFGEKNPVYWYPTTAAVADRDTVRNNVPAPSSTADVTEYIKDLDDNFVGNKVKYALTSAAQNELYSLTGNMAPVDYSYKFAPASEQPTITGLDGKKYQFYVKGSNSADKDTLQIKATPQDSDDNNVAFLDVEGNIEYADTDIAKELLNLFAHSDAKPNHMFAKIDVIATYGACKLDLREDSFNVRFLRPIDVLNNENGVFIDAEADGSKVILGDLLSLQDWRDKALIKYNATTKLYEAVEENGVDLFAYYQFANVKVDLANAECDMTGERKPLKDVTTEVKLSVIASDGSVSADNIVALTIDNLNKVAVKYENNGANVQDFKLWLPLEITYSWGTLNAWVECSVDGTIANN